VKLFPTEAPSINARTIEWQEYFQTASDLDIAHCWQAAVSQQQYHLQDIAFAVMGGRAIYRALQEECTIKLPTTALLCAEG
jgi:hypothetical protein